MARRSSNPDLDIYRTKRVYVRSYAHSEVEWLEDVRTLPKSYVSNRIPKSWGTVREQVPLERTNGMEAYLVEHESGDLAVYEADEIRSETVAEETKRIAAEAEDRQRRTEAKGFMRWCGNAA